MFIKDSHLDKLKIDNQTNMVNNILTEVENIQKSVKKIADDKLQEKINKYNELLINEYNQLRDTRTKNFKITQLIILVLSFTLLFILLLFLQNALLKPLHNIKNELVSLFKGETNINLGKINEDNL